MVFASQFGERCEIAVWSQEAPLGIDSTHHRVCRGYSGTGRRCTRGGCLMNNRILLTSAFMLAATAAFAAPPAPNLSVNISAPGAAPNVYSYAGYTVNVAN